MIDSIKKAWDNEYQVDSASPLYELMILMSGIVGIFIAWISTLMPLSVYIFVAFAYLYIVLWNKNELISKMIGATPLVYRANKKSFYKYFLFINVRENSFIYGFVFYMLGILIISIAMNRIVIGICVLDLALVILSVLLDKLTHASNLIARISLYFLIGLTYWATSSNKFGIVIIITIVILYLYIHLLLKLSGYKYESYKVASKSLKYKGYFSSSIRYTFRKSIFSLIFMLLYFVIAQKFNFTSSILPLMVLFVVFEAEVQLQITIRSQAYSPARIIFLSNVSLLNKLLYGPFLYKIFWLLIISIPISIYIIFLQPMLAVQAIICYGLVALICIYCALAEEEIAISSVKKPKFWEEYAMLVVIIGLCLI